MGRDPTARHREGTSVLGASAGLGVTAHRPVGRHVEDLGHPLAGGDVLYSVTSRVGADYMKALAALRDDLQRQAGAAGGRFVHTRSDEDLQAAMLAAMRSGVVRRS